MSIRPSVRPSLVIPFPYPTYPVLAGRFLPSYPLKVSLFLPSMTDFAEKCSLGKKKGCPLKKMSMKRMSIEKQEKCLLQERDLVEHPSTYQPPKEASNASKGTLPKFCGIAIAIPSGTINAMARNPPPDPFCTTFFFFGHKGSKRP